MTASPTGSGAIRPTALWAVSLSALGVFLCTLALCWVNAYVVNDDLPNTCGDLRRQSFPPEVACASVDGTLTGANAGWIEALFFASLVVFVLLASMLLALASVRRK
ncbi:MULTISPECIES: hypothetical protein [Streptomyces]|uniref:Uncharacterized protein n=1 Tax=Streptomyces chartreusis NRRL 3882 TaxID=1079985 RepID=A0A2N9BLU9_STRCX|nr:MULTISPECIES: hypothetical protein [Streptomyces]MYS88710.1 hypothetical protein [Streptomyces sp. SID5464]SOR84336.1 hypothetical protein SCNRRL3882_7781 [Streptomyces chartreusis NRRL 3882]